MSQAKRPRESTGSGVVGRLNQLLVLLCLTGLAVTEPLLAIFGVNPGIFYFHNIDSLSLLVSYAAALALLPALAIFAVVMLAGFIHRRLGSVLYLVFVGLLAAFWISQFSRWSVGVESPILLAAVSVLVAFLFVLAYVKMAALNTLLQIGAIAPLLALLAFLFFSDAGSSGSISPGAEIQTDIDSSMPSVLFVMLDEFPTVTLFDGAGAVDATRFPHLAELAAQSTWYRHYSVLAGQTTHSVPSILSGVNPVSESPNLANYPDNLFTFLAPTHHLTVFETLTKLCGLAQCSESAPGETVLKALPQWREIFSKTLTLWLQRVSLSQKGTGRLDDFEEKLVIEEPVPAAPESQTKVSMFDPGIQVGFALAKPERLQHFVGTFSPQQTALYFVHLELPHLPWRFYASGEVYSLPYKRPPISPGNNDGGDWLARFSEHRYLIQAQYTDTLLGGVIERLKTLAMWDDMLVVVTADHGRSFLKNTNGRALQPRNLGSTVYAPLFIKQPQQKSGVIDDSNLMAYDLLPTIANSLAIEIPWELEGFAAGDERIAQREGQKVYYPVKPQYKLLPDLAGQSTFSDAEKYPSYDSRRLGILQPGESALAQLNNVLALDQFMGKAPADFSFTEGGVAVLDELEELQKPSDKKPLQGVIIGNLEFEPQGDRVLIAVNDVFVTGSPLVEFKKVPYTFVAMLPSKVLQGRNEIGVYLVTENGLEKLSLH